MSEGFPLDRSGLSDPVSALVRQVIMLTDEAAFARLQGEFFEMKEHHELPVMEPMLSWCVLFKKIPVVNVVRAVLAGCCPMLETKPLPAVKSWVRLARHCEKVSMRFRLRASAKDLARVRVGLVRRLGRALNSYSVVGRHPGLVLSPEDCSHLFLACEGVLAAEAEAA